MHLIRRCIQCFQAWNNMQGSWVISPSGGRTRPMRSPCCIQTCTPPILMKKCCQGVQNKNAYTHIPELPTWASQKWQTRVLVKPVNNRWHFPWHAWMKKHSWIAIKQLAHVAHIKSFSLEFVVSQHSNKQMTRHSTMASLPSLHRKQCRFAVSSHWASPPVEALWFCI